MESPSSSVRGDAPRELLHMQPLKASAAILSGAHRARPSLGTLRLLRAGPARSTRDSQPTAAAASHWAMAPAFGIASQSTSSPQSCICSPHAPQNLMHHGLAPARSDVLHREAPAGKPLAVAQVLLTASLVNPCI